MGAPGPAESGKPGADFANGLGGDQGGKERVASPVGCRLPHALRRDRDLGPLGLGDPYRNHDGPYLALG